MVNPLVDITAVTVIIGGYGIAQSPVLALKTPIFLAYFVILAARPVTSSARKSAAAAILALTQYLTLVMFFALSGRLAIISSPLTASSGAGVSPLDEGAKLMLLGLAGAVATYATYWHEALVRTHHSELRNRQELEVRLTRAQLQSLKLQLHPHFLFNALNTVTALIRRDPDAAERTVSGLSETLRLSLRNAGDQEVALARELEVLQHYIDIQQIRFQNRLTVSIAIDPDVRQAMIPNLLLQPLVENAIRHGIEPRACGGSVAIRASRDSGRLMMTITDDGVGLRDQRSSKGHGIGVANTRERLSRLYGGQHKFVIREAASGGVVVEIEIPFRRAGGEALQR
jgi:two-component sensor histidine kinase